MTLIKDIIKISGGYADVVNLQEHFLNPTSNAQLMARYKPIKAHREAFEKIANALNSNDKRFYFLSGSYGTGKSHLCLMAANYFSAPSNTLEMEEFFKNYELAQKEVKLKKNESFNEKTAKDLKVRRKEGEFLIAICNYDLNLEFEGTILRAVEGALKKSGLELDTHYQEALRKIEEWEKKKNERPFYNDLNKELDNKHKDWSVDDIIKGLKEKKEEAYKIFKSVHKEITSADFNYNKDNLQDILKDILTNEAFKEKYKGLVVLFDEFGYALDDNLVNLKKMQQFAEFCATSKMNHHPVVFIGTGHKAFYKHGQVGDDIHFKTISHRVEEIPLQTQGMEDIIGAIISIDKSTKAYKEKVEPKQSVFENFTGECKRLKLFDWLEAPKLENYIVKNIYPMHPHATYSLLQLAKEVSAETRSVFQFFSVKMNDDTGEWENVQPYSYPWFIQNNEIQKNNSLNLYTADLLYHYFIEAIDEDEKKISESKKQVIKDYKESLRTLNRYLAKDSEEKLIKKDDYEEDEFFDKVLKALLINELVSNEKTPIPNTKENVFFALNIVSDGEKKAISQRLEILYKIGVISFKDDVYELRKSNVKDIDQLVDNFKADPDNRPANLLEELFKYERISTDEEYLESKDYNTTYNEDKRLKSRYVTPEEFSKNNFIVNGEEVSFIEHCVDERKKAGIGNDGYDGTAIYLFCQSDEEINTAQSIARNNNSEEVVVCIPKKPFNILNDILTLKAHDHIKSSPDAENFGTIENSALNELKKAALTNLRDTKAKWFDNKLVDWYSVNGTREKVSDSKKHDIANKVIEKKFIKVRNKFVHADFNMSHPNINQRTKQILNEAIEALMDLSQSVKIEWNLPPNRGAFKYIQKCFVEHQFLRIIKTEGEYRYLEPETDKSKFAKVIPAYNVMLEELNSKSGEGWQNFNEFIKKYYEEYGLGQIAVVLLFLLARKYYGDSIRIRKDETDLIDLKFNDPSIPFDLISMTYPNAVFKFEPVSKEHKKYFSNLYQTFNPSKAEAGKSYSIAEAYKSISDWWTNLPSVVKIIDFYVDKEKEKVKLFSTIESADPYAFVKKELLESLGYQEGEVLDNTKLKNIEKSLTDFKELVESKEENQKNIIREHLKDIFNAETKTDVDIVEAIKTWYHDELDSYQKDPISDFHNNESKALIRKINSIVNQTNFLFTDLPEQFGLDQFNNWSIDKTNDFINKVKAGKKHIEENSSPVGEIEINTEGKVERDKNDIKYKGEFELEAHTDKEDDIIYYTEDGSDPSDEKSQRKQLKKGEKIKVKGNKTIKLIVKEPSGRYGAVKSINTIDESQKCLIKRAGASFFGEDRVTFVFPSDEDDVKVALSSFLNEVKAADIITKEKLKQIINNILKEI